MKMAMQLDTREFTAALRQYQKLSKKDDVETVKDRAGKLAFSLFAAFKNVAPSVALLKSLPEKLNWRIKRRAGHLPKAQKGTKRFKQERRLGRQGSVKREINRRIAARFAAAFGWLAGIKRFSKKKASLKKKGREGGAVIINTAEPSVTLINAMKQGVKAEEKYHLMQSALDAQVADMRIYIEPRLAKRAKQFSAR